MYESFPSPGQYVYMKWKEEHEKMVQAMRLVHYIEDEMSYGALLVRNLKPAPGESIYDYLPTASMTCKKPNVVFRPVEEQHLPKEFLESKKGTRTARLVSKPETWEEQLQTTLDENVDGWDEAEEDKEMCLFFLRRTNKKIYEIFLNNAILRSAEEAHKQNRCKDTHEARLVTQAALAFIHNEQRAEPLNDRGSEKSKKRQGKIMRDLLAQAQRKKAAPPPFPPPLV